MGSEPVISGRVRLGWSSIFIASLLGVGSTTTRGGCSAAHVKPFPPWGVCGQSRDGVVRTMGTGAAEESYSVFEA